MTDAPPTSAATLDLVVSALRRGDYARAEAALAAGNVDREAMLRLAELNLRRQRWADAVWLFDHATDPLPAEAAFKRNLARNLSSLMAHRPDVGRRIAATRASDEVTITRSATGHPTIAIRQPDGTLASLSTEDRPLAASEAALRQLRPVISKGLAMGLAGIGDGYLLYRLAHDKTELILGLQLPVFLIEPDLRIALCAMMIHDYSGPDGPIEQQRFTWLIGDDWAAQFRAISAAQPMLGAPSLTVSFTESAQAVREELHRISQEVVDRDRATADAVAAYYADRDPAVFADLVSPNGSRKPRVMFITTRFSTVLQYSTRDTAAAFEQLGWDAKVLIEQAAHHRLYQTAIRRELADYKPDLVFQIDHLRYEHGDMFPPNLPFVCWAQDHLPNLAGDAGKTVGPTEFVLTDGIPTYVHDYRYPERQCIGMTKLTSVRPPSADAPNLLDRVEDVVFVSNASRLPELLLADRMRRADGPKLAVLAEAAGQIQSSFAAGAPLCTYVRIRELVEQTSSAMDIPMNRDEVRDVASWLYHPYTDATYRQQAMTWAADACRQLGLSFGLYGKGWESHPVLSGYACGPIENGPALWELTRRAQVNLQVVPYLCLHQRLLDGLCAGGFFLIREHSSDVAPQAMIDLLSRHGAGDAMSVTEARTKLAACTMPDSGARGWHGQAYPLARGDRQPAFATGNGVPLPMPPNAPQSQSTTPSSMTSTAMATFEALLQECRDCLCNSGLEDPIEYVQSLRQAGLLTGGREVLPQFDQTSFRDAAGLLSLLRRYTTNLAERSAIAARQQADVNDRFTYVAGMKRMVETIAERLATDSRRHGHKSTPMPQEEPNPRTAGAQAA